jgi:hypothetical protein
MDTSDELLRLRMALRYFPALKEELEAIKSSSTNIRHKQGIIKQFYTLEETIARAMAPVRTSYYLTCT